MHLRTLRRTGAWAAIRRVAANLAPVLVLLAVGSITLTASPRFAAAQTPQARLTNVEHDAQGSVAATVIVPPGTTLDRVEASIDGSPARASFERPTSESGSGSLVLAIEASANTAPSVLAQSRSAVYALLDALPAGVQVAVVAYGDDATLLSDFTTDREATRSAVAGITARGASALYDAVHLAGSLLEGAPSPRVMGMFGWGWEYGGASTISRSASLEPFGADATAHIFALGGEHDVRYANELASRSGGTYHLAVLPAALGTIASGFAQESSAYTIRLESPGLSGGAHDLMLRLTVSGVLQEVGAQFDVATPATIALGEPALSEDGASIEVPVQLGSVEGLGEHSISADAAGTPLSLAGPQGPVLIDAWRFEAGPLPIEVTLVAGGRALAEAAREVSVPVLAPELVLERLTADGDSSSEELSITWRVQGGGAELLVTSGGQEVLRTANGEVLIPIPAGAPILAQLLGDDGSVLTQRTDGQPTGAMAAGGSDDEAGGGNVVPIALGILAVFAIGGGAAAFLVRYQLRRRWQNAPGAGAITAEHLYTALTNGEMTLHYQPILSATGDRLVGVEALVRWEHPLFGTVSPRRFLAKADATGVMRYLGEFVLRTGCDFIHELHESRLPGVRLTVNASTSELRDPEFPNAVERALRESGLDARYLEVEVNERASLVEPAVLEGLARIRALGVAIGLDDFWSESLTAEQLRTLGVSSVKVDLWSNTGSAGARLRIREAVEMARSLGLMVTAKRVETLHEVEFLRELRCDFAQGHAFNEAMPEDVFLARMGLFEEEERLAS